MKRTAQILFLLLRVYREKDATQSKGEIKDDDDDDDDNDDDATTYFPIKCKKSLL